MVSLLKYLPFLISFPLYAQILPVANGGTGLATAVPTVRYVAGGGSANAQTATYSPALTSLITGINACWLPTAANTTTTPTFAPNGLTAKTITKLGTTALVASDITTTAVACAIYDGTEWQLQNPQTVSAGGGGALVNITSSLTPTNCTITGGVCATTGSVSTVTLASIPSGYTSIRFIFQGLSSAGANFECRFNGDTGNNYGDQSGAFTPSGGSTPAHANQAFAICGIFGTFSAAGSIEIPFYTTSGPKNYIFQSCWFPQTSSTSNFQGWVGNGIWNSSAAITSITFLLSTGTISSGTSFAVYGIN